MPLAPCPCFLPRGLWRSLAGLMGLALLSACASNGPQVSSVQLAARFRAAARPSDYAPPGSPSDPWGPYIAEAAQRFDVPQRWIREVMAAESGGQEFIDGQLTTSPAGAMGLMQVMPETYEELRLRYGLDDDPYNPHDNIMAGTAYIREMYDLFGSPGFLAAYNAGPATYSAYLSGQGALPEETRSYVAMIAPRIGTVRPAQLSEADLYAMYDPPGLTAPPPPSREPRPLQVATLPLPPPRYMSLPPVPPTPSRPAGFYLIAPAVAEPVPVREGAHEAGAWAIQVGAYDTPARAHLALIEAAARAKLLQLARPLVERAEVEQRIFFRARLAGLSRETAIDACQLLINSSTGCIVLSPAAQG